MDIKFDGIDSFLGYFGERYIIPYYNYFYKSFSKLFGDKVNEQWCKLKELLKENDDDKLFLKICKLFTVRGFVGIKSETEVNNLMLPFLNGRYCVRISDKGGLAMSVYCYIKNEPSMQSSRLPDSISLNPVSIKQHLGNKIDKLITLKPISNDMGSNYLGELPRLSTDDEKDAMQLEKLIDRQSSVNITPDISMIGNNLYLSSYKFYENIEQLDENTCIISIVSDVDNPDYDLPEILHNHHIVEFIDGENDLNKAKEAIKKIVQLIEEKIQVMPVLIHCRAGVNRSASVVIAYLNKTGLNLNEAILKVRNARNIIAPIFTNLVALVQLSREN